jgi:hypothetical protein
MVMLVLLRTTFSVNSSESFDLRSVGFKIGSEFATF